MSSHATDQKLETTIDAALQDTFPASDPPSWTLGREALVQTQTSAEVTSSDEETRLTILGIAGSLRRASYNRALLRAAQQLVPAHVALDLFDLADVPLFNQDEEQKPPAAVVEFKARIRAADAVLFATPEYNYSIPGVLKNAIDWASRPSGDNAWSGKPVAVIGASVGRLGTARAQYHLQQVFVTLNMYALNQPEAMIDNAGELFDAEGTLADEKMRDHVRRLLNQFALWTRQVRNKRTQ